MFWNGTYSIRHFAYVIIHPTRQTDKGRISTNNWDYAVLFHHFSETLP